MRAGQRTRFRASSRFLPLTCSLGNILVYSEHLKMTFGYTCVLINFIVWKGMLQVGAICRVWKAEPLELQRVLP